MPSLDELQEQIKSGAITLQEAIALCGAAEPKTYPIVVKRNRSGGVYVVHPSMGDKFGMNFTPRQAEFLCSEAFANEIVPLIKALPPGCAEPKSR